MRTLVRSRHLASAVLSRRLVCVLLFLTAVAMVSPPTVFMASGRTVLVVAPHPDDEALLASGVIRQAISNGDTVYVALMTNGDTSPSVGTSNGYTREAETVTAMGLLGLAESKVIFLGYGDQSLYTLYSASSATTVYTSMAGQTATYANRGLGSKSYHAYLYGSAGAYNRQTAAGDVSALISNIKPTDIYTVNDYDDLPDHYATALFVTDAVIAARKAGLTPVPRIHSSVVHWNYTSWPAPVFTPTTPYPTPPNLDLTPMPWLAIESIPVPANMQLTSTSTNLKHQAIAAYPSQGTSDFTSYLYDYCKKNEFFWVNNVGLNVALDATVTDSSENTASKQTGVKAIDGKFAGYRADATTEWAAASGQMAGSWIQLNWSSSVSLSHIALHDPTDGNNKVLGGTLSFSDGSSITVGALSNYGSALNVLFSPKTVTWARFTITSATGASTGLSEFEAFGKYVSSSTNSAPYFVGQPSAFPGGIAPTQSTTLTAVANDVDGSTLTYAWSADGGTIVGNGSQATFTAPNVTSNTVYTVTVTVTDGKGGSATNTAYVYVNTSLSTLNVASLATVTQSTQYTDSGQLGIRAVDGIVDGYPSDYTKEWATNGELAGGWIQLTWGSALPITQVVLHDRINTTDQVKAGTLTFSDGSSASVGTLPNDGTGLTVTFATKTVTWVKFTVTSAVGGSTGLAEIEVWRAPGAVTLTGIGLNPASVVGGTGSTGTVTLSGAAPTGGAVVSLTSGNTAVATVPASVTVPAGSASATFTVATAAVSSTSSSTITASYSGTSLTATLAVTPQAPLSISTTSLAAGTVGAAYTQTLTATGGTPPYGWSATGLPDGLTMSNAGVLSGTPTSAGIFSVTVVATDSAAVTATATLSLTIAAAPAMAIDASVSADASSTGTTITTPALTTAAGNELLLAFIAASSPGTGTNTTVTGVTNTGTALTWTKAARSNTQPGTAEIWWAYSTSTVSGTVTATVSQSVSSRSITVLSITGTAVGADGIGATGGASSASGAPTASLITTQANAWVFGTGNDWSAASSRTVGSGQTMVHQYLSTTTGDTYWVQRQTSLTPTAGTTVAISDTAPTGDIYNLSVVEIHPMAGLSVSSVSLSPTSVVGGNTSTGTVTLSGAAPSGGATVTLSDDSASVSVPASVTVPQGSTSATFTVSTVSVSSATSSTITATYNTTSQTATLAVTAPLPTVTGLSLNPTSVAGGTSSTGTVTLSAAAQSGGAVVSLTSSNTSAATAPTSVTVAQGSTSATFTVSTLSVTTATTSTITATYNSTSQSASLAVTVPLPMVAGVSLNPTSVQGGTPSTGTVTLGAPAQSGGAVVTLTSSNTAAATVPASVTVPEGSTITTFTVTTLPVASTATSTITASSNGTSKTATLTVTVPAALAGVSLNPTSLLGGNTSTGTVTLTAAAPAGGITVALASSNTLAATVPGSVTVLQGSTSATFTVSTFTVASVTTSTVTATCNGVSQTATLTVNPPPALSITTTSLAGGFVGAAYTQALTATGGTAPYAWSAAGLPDGLVVSSAGAISGTPTSAGTFSVTVTVTDNASATVSATFSLTVVATQPLAIDASVSADSSSTGPTITSPTLTTAAANELLVAFIAGSDNGSLGNTVTGVTNTGTALTWTLAVRKNTQHGTSEIWWAYATTTFSGTVTATMSQSPSSCSMTVVSFTGTAVGADAIGATGSGSSGAGAPTASLVTTRGGSWVFGAGNDYSSATSRTVGTNQTMVHPYLASTGDTYWVQRQNNTTAAPGTTVAINDTAPTGDMYNLAVIEIRPVPGPATLASVSLSPTSVVGGNNSTGTVTLTAAAPAGGATVTLIDDNAAVTVPTSVTVPAGSTTATFTVSTSSVTSSTTGTITATYSGTSQSATLTVTAAPPTLTGVSLNPTSVKGGTSSTGTVTLSTAAPTGGVVITLKSSSTTVATVPASVTVPAGSTTATFTVSTKTRTSTTTCTITATYSGTSKTATLTVTP